MLLSRVGGYMEVLAGCFMGMVISWRGEKSMKSGMVWLAASGGGSRRSTMMVVVACVATLGEEK